jgi:hypothetical protein
MNTKSPSVPFNIVAGVRQELATRFNLPELLAAQLVPCADMRKLVANVIPSGQMALLVRSLEVEVLMFITAERPEVVEVRLEMSYKHHDGGSNGITRYFIAGTSPVAADEMEYEGLVSRAAARSIIAAFRK